MNNIYYRYNGSARFAAANGYNGFRSYFDKIFKSQDYEAIYVLKGGPGTGKSTLLKRIIEYSQGLGYMTEAILCSSDPLSLDGAIIKRGNKQIAILDGTAPHERDAVVPGAIDTIVNLAEGFDRGRLRAEKDRILELCEEKRKVYKYAYSGLSAAGKLHDMAFGIFENSRLNYEAESLIQRVVSKTPHSNPTNSSMLLSAFCKNGLVSLPELEATKRKTVYIQGNGVSEYLFMNRLRELCINDGLLRETYISPFSESLIEGLATDEYLVRISRTPDALDVTSPDDNTSTFIYDIMEIYNHTLRISSLHFRRASEAHMQLEEIYSKATDFRNNDRIAKQICSELDEYLAP